MGESIMMMIKKVRSSLESLSQLAPKLNEATDLYMDELKEIEAALRSLNLGIAVELDKWIYKENPKTEWNNGGESIGESYKAWTLGYGRDNHGTWCFLVREYKVPNVPAGTNPYPKEVVEQDVAPLLQVARDLRIAAAKRIPELLKEMELNVKKKIELLAEISDKR